MHGLTYSSLATFPLDDHEIGTLLEASRRRNAGAGITGVLLYLRLDDGSAAFVQRLEGPRPQVEETFRRIERDELHTAVVVLDDGACDGRRFGDWTMKFVEVDRTDLRPADARAQLRDRAAVAALIESGPGSPP